MFLTLIYNADIRGEDFLMVTVEDLFFNRASKIVDLLQSKIILISGGKYHSKNIFHIRISDRGTPRQNLRPDF